MAEPRGRDRLGTRANRCPIEIDATFAGSAWDGRSSLPLACGPGRDYPAGEDPDAEKQALEARHCDPSIREPFIVALASMERAKPSPL